MQCPHNLGTLSNTSGKARAMPRKHGAFFDAANEAAEEGEVVCPATGEVVRSSKGL